MLELSVMWAGRRCSVAPKVTFDRAVCKAHMDPIDDKDTAAKGVVRVPRCRSQRSRAECRGVGRSVGRDDDRQVQTQDDRTGCAKG